MKFGSLNLFNKASLIRFKEKINRNLSFSKVTEKINQKKLVYTNEKEIIQYTRYVYNRPSEKIAKPDKTCIILTGLTINNAHLRSEVIFADALRREGYKVFQLFCAGLYNTCEFASPLEEDISKGINCDKCNSLFNKLNKVVQQIDKNSEQWFSSFANNFQRKWLFHAWPFLLDSETNSWCYFSSDLPASAWRGKNRTWHFFDSKLKSWRMEI